jgi:exonuclease SbcD
MKFIHLGDLHLGKKLYEYSLIEDQRYILDEILKIADQRNIKGVVIAGDIYDQSRPSEDAVKLLNYFLNELAKRKIYTFIISGNHDSDERLNYGSALFEKNGIFIAAKYDGSLFKKTITDEYGELDVYLLPFVKASQVRHYFPEEEINDYDGAVRAVIRHAAIDASRRNIIVAHQFVTGRKRAVSESSDADGSDTEAFDPVLGGSESIGTRSVGTVEKIGYDIFDGFDYAALGHIHSPQRVGREEVRYSGSPLKYSLSECGCDKSVPIVSFKEKGEVSVELVPLEPKRDLRHLEGKLEELLKKENVRDTDDFIYATLTDEDHIDNAMEIIRQTYKNTVKIDYHNSRTNDIYDIDISDITEKQSFEEMIGSFYKMIFNTAMTEEEMKYLKASAKEAGITGETD